MLIRVDHKKEITNTDWVNEKISEVFDDATEMMSESSIIYGGAIRDALAGMTLSGDIDIAVNTREYDSVVAKFRSSVKWISKNNPNNIRMNSSKPDYRIWLPKLSNLSSFVHMNGNIAQVISVNTKDVCSIVRDVDIVCCAVIMTYDGHVFEVVAGAHEDCIAKVLRLNKTKNVVNISETPERIKKLVGRGWKSLITDKQIERAVVKFKKSVNIDMKVATTKFRHGGPVRSKLSPHAKPLKQTGNFYMGTDIHAKIGQHIATKLEQQKKMDGTITEVASSGIPKMGGPIKWEKCEPPNIGMGGNSVKWEIGNGDGVVRSDGVIHNNNNGVAFNEAPLQQTGVLYDGVNNVTFTIETPPPSDSPETKRNTDLSTVPIIGTANDINVGSVVKPNEVHKASLGPSYVATPSKSLQTLYEDSLYEDHSEDHELVSHYRDNYISLKMDSMFDNSTLVSTDNHNRITPTEQKVSAPISDMAAFIDSMGKIIADPATPGKTFNDHQKQYMTNIHDKVFPKLKKKKQRR